MKSPDVYTKAIIAEYLGYLSINGFTKTKIESHAWILNRFFNTYDKDLEKVKNQDIEDWIERVAADKKGTKRLHNILHTFYLFCLENQYID